MYNDNDNLINYNETLNIIVSEKYCEKHWSYRSS